MRDAIARINGQGRNSNGTVASKKVTTHFISSWGLAGDDMLEDSPEYAALATKVSATFRQRDRTARGDFQDRPPKRKQPSNKRRQAHTILPKVRAARHDGHVGKCDAVEQAAFEAMVAGSGTIVAPAVPV